MPKLKPDLLTLFRRSAALQRIATDEKRLRQIAKADPRKIIPVAKVARLLEVSNRQMWNWIGQGWISTYNRPSVHYRKGISKAAFTRFLSRVLEQHANARWIDSPVSQGRPPQHANGCGRPT